MRLELGAGYRPTPGFIHNDMHPGPDIEIVHPAETISQAVGEGACSEIRATHLLEHFSFRQTVEVLKEWGRALQSGGQLYLEVPNFGWQTRAHASGEIGDETAVNLMYGDQDYEGNSHYAGFTEALLTKRLEEAGYVNVRTQDIGMVINAWAVKP